MFIRRHARLQGEVDSLARYPYSNESAAPVLGLGIEYVAPGILQSHDWIVFIRLHVVSEIRSRGRTIHPHPMQGKYTGPAVFHVCEDWHRRRIGQPVWRIDPQLHRAVGKKNLPRRKHQHACPKRRGKSKILVRYRWRDRRYGVRARVEIEELGRSLE